jgi:YbgC/YbaW family acyl-CoA thioester hydrolase
VAYEFTLTRHVEFSETDTDGIIHFSNYFKYMEAAEHAFFRSLGMSIFPQSNGDHVGWPRVHAECDFSYPLRFEDVVEIRLLVSEKKDRTISYQFLFRKLNEEPAREVGRGKLIVACVRRDKETGKLKSAPIPAEIAGKIDVAPGELLAR